MAENLSQTVGRLIAEYFAAHHGMVPPAGLYDRVLREVEKPLIEQTLKVTGGNQIKAAEVLGLNRNTLRKKIRALNIEVRK
jgi:two-component system nitrogen regulation response regulator GlnG